ncbi:MAG: TA system VapC family ribonuclease toxin [Terriglobales bacterium]
MSFSIFPDTSVWVALSVSRHVHHGAARHWFERRSADTRYHFCRLTQMGLLRLLSQDAVMGAREALGQEAAWATYDRWLEDLRVDFLDEPAGLEVFFRQWPRSLRPAPQRWSDDYLCAFAGAAGLRLATFDRALQQRQPGAILVGGAPN